MKKGAVLKALVLDASIFALLFAFELYSGIEFDPMAGVLGFIIVFFLLLPFLSGS